MSKEKPVAAEDIEALDPVEGGVFYPVGCIVVGLPDHDAALRLQRNLIGSGLQQQDCALQPGVRDGRGGG